MIGTGAITVGVDIGSVATKAIVFDGSVINRLVIPTGWNPAKAGREAIDGVLTMCGLRRRDVVRTAATGYGRVSLPDVDYRLNEIQCHAAGAHFSFPAMGVVIDIGGQDSKIIAFDKEGFVADFVMNDKCAAGTGRFLERMADVLGITMDELGAMSACSEPVAISSMCTVFAESEIVGLLARKESKGGIASGVVHSIASRVISLMGRIDVRGRLIFTGGLAANAGIRTVLSRCLNSSIGVPPHPQTTAAVGAAILARNALDEK